MDWCVLWVGSILGGLYIGLKVGRFLPIPGLAILTSLTSKRLFNYLLTLSSSLRSLYCNPISISFYLSKLRLKSSLIFFFALLSFSSSRSSIIGVSPKSYFANFSYITDFIGLCIKYFGLASANYLVKRLTRVDSWIIEGGSS